MHDSYPTLPKQKRHPYYVVAPNYERKSAGIRTLHFLCHWLNRRGYPAYIQTPGGKRGQVTHPDLITPLLTPEVVAAHEDAQRTPIVVYPEIVSGNPLNADCVARYVLNYPGLLGGDKIYAAGEMVFGYTQYLADAVKDVSGVLFFPVVDTETFRPGTPRQRQGVCFYAAKFRDKGYEPFDLPAGAVEILRGSPNDQSPEQIAELFRTCELFYCYEDTALILEAALCGCPSVVMPSAFFREPLGTREFGYDGIARNNSSQEIDRAIATVERVAKIYADRSENFLSQLDAFIEITQDRAAVTIPTKRVMLPPKETRFRRRLLRLRKKLGL